MGAKDIPVVLDALAAIAKSVGLFVVIPIVLYRLLKSPPKWTSRIFVTKASLLGAEVEIARNDRDVVSEQRNLESGQVAEPPPPEPIEEVARRDSESGFAHFLRADELFRHGRFVDGLADLRESLATEPDRRKAIGDLAFGYYLAFRSGIAPALDGLIAYVRENSANSESYRWLAQAFVMANRSTDAIKTLEQARQIQDILSERVATVVALSQLLTSRKRFSDATSALSGIVSSDSPSDEQVRIYRAMAEVYEASEDRDLAMLMYEKAISVNPGGWSLRFDVAYKYGDHGAPGLATHHYRRVLEQQPNHQATLNNLGIAAQALDLPSIGVQYLRDAEQTGSTLAMSNLATTFLNAGFTPEADAILQLARDSGTPDDRVAIVAGDVVRTAKAEEAKLDALLKRVIEVRRLRLRLVDAILSDPIDARLLVGEYEGTPYPLTLELASDGTLTGVFRRVLGEDGVFRAVLTGQALRFVWRSKVREVGLLSNWDAVTDGHGLLIVDENGLSGYVASDSHSLDVKEWKGFHEWKVHRKADSPVIPLRLNAPVG